MIRSKWQQSPRSPAQLPLLSRDFGQYKINRRYTDAGLGIFTAARAEVYWQFDDVRRSEDNLSVYGLQLSHLYSSKSSSFRAINNSDTAITGAFASDVDRTDWGDDLLGTRVVPPGASYLTRPVIDRGYCMFVVKATFSDGTDDVISGINLCEVSRLEFDDSGHSVR